MKSHLNKLNEINSSNPMRFKEVTRSTDMKVRHHNAIKQQNNEFKVNQMRKEMAKENKFLFMKLVDI